jgi:hypothetical protein
VTFASPCVTEIPSIVLEGEIGPGTVIALQRRIVEALNTGQRRQASRFGDATRRTAIDPSMSNK